MKAIRFVGSSLHDLRQMPDRVRHDLGVELMAVQFGGEPTDFKPMKTIGSGAYEIRHRAVDGAFRVIYVARFEEAVYVLHAFQKKTQKTARSDIELARRRYFLIEAEHAK